MALEFGKLGCKLVLWDINSDNIEMVAAELRQQEVEAHTYTCDVSNSESVYSVANKVFFVGFLWHCIHTFCLIVIQCIL